MNKLEEVKGLFHRYIDEDLSLIEPIKERVVLLQELRKVYVAYDNEIQTLKAEKEEIFKEIEDKFKEPKLYDGWIYDYYIKSISSEDWEKLIQKYTKEE